MVIQKGANCTFRSQSSEHRDEALGHLGMCAAQAGPGSDAEIQAMRERLAAAGGRLRVGDCFAGGGGLSVGLKDAVNSPPEPRINIPASSSTPVDPPFPPLVLREVCWSSGLTTDPGTPNQHASLGALHEPV